MDLGCHDMNQTCTTKSDQEQIPIEKNLGVIEDNTLTFKKHINSKTKIANGNLGLILRTFTYVDKKLFTNLFKSAHF